VLDIGLGEVVIIAIIALLVFGPEKLPKMAADAAKTLRQVRQMASAARKDLSDAAGLHDDAGLGQTVRDIQSLDPRRALRGLGDDPAPGRPAAGPAGRPAQTPASQPSAGASPAGAGPAAGPAGTAAHGASSSPSEGAASSSASAGGSPGGPTSAPRSTEPVAGPVLEPEPVDPDWT
jgi:sec-independent protein translocase protein TatB